MIGNIISKAAEYNVRRPEDFVKYSSAAANAFSYACQTAAFTKSKSIPEDKRKFVVAQEAAEGIVSTALILTIAQKFKQLGEVLVEKALIVPKDLPDKFKNAQSITNILKNNSEYADIVQKCRSSVALATSSLGIALTFAVITPIVRNKMANVIKKWMDKDQNKAPNNESPKKQNPEPQLQEINKDLYKSFLTEKKRENNM